MFNPKGHTQVEILLKGHLDPLNGYILNCPTLADVWEITLSNEFLEIYRPIFDVTYRLRVDRIISIRS